MLHQDVGKTLRVTAAPMVIALMTIGSVGLVDAYFVSRVGTQELASLGYSIPVFYLLAALWIGFGIGATSTVARRLGAGDRALARRTGTDALLLAAPVLGVLALSIFLAKSALAKALGVPEELRPSVERFVTILVCGMPATAFVALASALLRGHGETRASGSLLVFASLGNMVLDPPLILGLREWRGFGVTGAALAAVGGYVLACVPAALALARRRLLAWAYDGEVPFAARARSVIAVSLPALLTQTVKPSALLVITAIVSRYGTAAVAAYVAASNVDRFVLNTFLGIASALAPIVGQNWGARRHDRVASVVRLAVRTTAMAGAAAWLVLLPLSGVLARGLETDLEAANILRNVLRTVPLGYAAAAVTMMSVSSLNAVGFGGRALATTVTQYLLGAVPFALAGSYIGGLRGIFCGLVAAEGLVALLAWRRLWVAGVVRAQPAPVGVSEPGARP